MRCIAVKRSFQATPVRRPGGRVGPCDALRPDYLPLALDRLPMAPRRRRFAGYLRLLGNRSFGSLLPLRALPRADGVLRQRIFVVCRSHDNAKISVGFFEGPDVFQGIAIGESAKQCDQGRFTKHNAPHPCTGQNAGCAQHWRSAVALDDNPPEIDL